MDNHHDKFPVFQTKELVIPDKVRVGDVIGKRGSHIKSLQENHKVDCAVDGDSRKLTLRGDEAGVKGAEDELAKLFACFDIAEPRRNRDFRADATNEPKQRRSQPAPCIRHVIDPSGAWFFERERVRSSDVNVKNHPYRLYHIASEASTPANSQEESWISVCREPNDERSHGGPSEKPIAVKVAFGKLCFNGRFPKSNIPWQELQNLEGFEVRWTNVRRQGYDVKYHFVDGQWKLRNVRYLREVRSRFDVFVDNETSFRLRRAIHEKVPDEIAESLQRHIIIATPGKIVFFTPEVTVNRAAPFALQYVDSKLKVHLEMKGLHFTISYLDSRRTELRLECRLPAAEMKELQPQQDHRVLLKKVLQLIRDDSC
ncbi:hypothetical protein PF010_g6481 [Phytophthora fragariae]|uniref:K Homology domain-containing protein n=1 Tax=Phytophthora fragariae TaxID=53985 RepID=A0A6A3FA54_9STRA|nr:hypothetical protein PF009_g8084 [Phytophthora fragariae]KAE9018880.1 hypothetical protein PF011_g6060 [Phytophthora fragariae]KAE9123197.1 hypothetical protein PF010_g6481 [Phytophthora fragariae]KAE9149025.1 hypothetical protein PF006_g6461 [Phytophthora fragariae]KAE9243950.1 hypothetical protein PF004_g5887 [Phytophthora fragariae]